MLVALGSGLLTYVVTSLGPGADISLSVLIGGVSLLVSYMVDFERRLEATESAVQKDVRETQDLVRRELRKINEATELFMGVESSAVGSDHVVQLVQSASRIVPHAPPLVAAFADGEIQRMTTLLKSLGDGGDVAYDGEDRDWLLGLTRNASATIDATSLTTVDAQGESNVDGGLWLSDLGQRYLEVQRDAVQRGVRIRRVFVLDRPEIIDDAGMREVVQLQMSLGIDVRVLDPSALTRTIRTSLLDFILFDGVVSYEVTPAARIADDSKPVIVSTRLVLRPDRVADRQQRFQDVWASARSLPETRGRHDAAGSTPMERPDPAAAAQDGRLAGHGWGGPAVRERHRQGRSTLVGGLRVLHRQRLVPRPTTADGRPRATSGQGGAGEHRGGHDGAGEPAVLRRRRRDPAARVDRCLPGQSRLGP
ncbi:DUF6879 family protein [Phytohabitans rumicis]|uniref:DUF6879 family protein n=1 Tax=Phytohabitans rumicis TaxID=1076125 RepID=UPI001566AA84|nr:DUF6879 family protein [Phytohabitans rumicis]